MNDHSSPKYTTLDIITNPGSPGPTPACLHRNITFQLGFTNTFNDSDELYRPIFSSNPVTPISNHTCLSPY